MLTKKETNKYEEVIIKLTEEEIKILKKMFRTKSPRRAIEKAIKDLVADELAYKSLADMQGVGGIEAIYD